MRFQTRRWMVGWFVAGAWLCASPFTAVADPTPTPTLVAIEVSGGGSKSTDCLTTFQADVNYPSNNPHLVRCTDGDSNCDKDGAVNGVCTIPVMVCANSTHFSCTLNGVSTITVDHALDNGDPKFDPDFQALQNDINSDLQVNGGNAPNETPNDCTDGGDITAASTVRVYIKGPYAHNTCSRSKTKTVRLTTVSEVINGHVYTDTDTLQLQCVPRANPCTPHSMYKDTYDRIQQQVFNQNCALSGCHDSQTHQNDLILEEGASYTNLVNVVPFNDVAAGQRWFRVDEMEQNASDDLAKSYIVHKIEGDFPGTVKGAYGARMPKGKPKLNSTLRSLIETWILNGAPTDDGTWVPGTY